MKKSRSECMKPAILQVLVFVFFLSPSWLLAQSRDAHTRFGDNSVPCFFIEVPSSAAQAASLLEERLKSEESSRPRTLKDGYVKLSKVRNLRISREFIDIYYKVAESDVNDNRVAQVTLLVSRGYDNFINGANDPELARNISSLLDGMLVEVQRRNLQAEIELQTRLVQEESDNASRIQILLEKLFQEKFSLEQKIDKSKSDLGRQKASEAIAREKLEQLKKLLLQFDEKLRESAARLSAPAIAGGE